MGTTIATAAATSLTTTEVVTKNVEAWSSKKTTAILTTTMAATGPSSSLGAPERRLTTAIGSTNTVARCTLYLNVLAGWDLEELSVDQRLMKALRATVAESLSVADDFVTVPFIAIDQQEPR